MDFFLSPSMVLMCYNFTRLKEEEKEIQQKAQEGEKTEVSFLYKSVTLKFHYFKIPH